MVLLVDTVHGMLRIFLHGCLMRMDRDFLGGNAKDWYANAQSERAKAAGIKVSRTMPKVGAIVVYQQLRSYAGHVAVVKSYDPSNWGDGC